jgi:hypothetical protein
MICILVYSTQSQIKTIFPSKLYKQINKNDISKEIFITLEIIYSFWIIISYRSNTNHSQKQVIRMSKQLINDI